MPAVSQVKAAFQCFNGYAPANGPKSIALLTDFTTDTFIDFDLTLELAMQDIEFIQSMFVDNVGNAQALTFAFQISQQRIVVPAQKQGTFPIIAPSPLKFRVSTTNGVGIAPSIILLNVPMPIATW